MPRAIRWIALVVVVVLGLSVLGLVASALGWVKSDRPTVAEVRDRVDTIRASVELSTPPPGATLRGTRSYVCTDSTDSGYIWTYDFNGPVESLTVFYDNALETAGWHRDVVRDQGQTRWVFRKHFGDWTASASVVGTTGGYEVSTGVAAADTCRG